MRVLEKTYAAGTPIATASVALAIETISEFSMKLEKPRSRNASLKLSKVGVKKNVGTDVSMSTLCLNALKKSHTNGTPHEAMMATTMTILRSFQINNRIP